MTITSHNLALLIAASQHGENAMHHDLLAMTQALQAHGLPADCIFSLHGQLDRALVLAFLHSVRRQMEGWRSGSLFVHVSSHGFVQGDTVENARPGLQLRNTADFTAEHHLFWDEFFAALALPTGVHLTLLPDL
ncbi:MAG: hypothetical protein R3C14_36920 [Caldilineaceae bacterium]